jgi:aspartyl-tRNA(Asn)/glutamyl-tRNA(Gln) amidotransferase subunit A
MTGPVARLFGDVDVLVLPTTTAVPMAIGAAKGNPTALSPANTMFANYFGLPAISVPCGFADNGLPVGLQIVGQPGADATVLSLAHAYETATDWRSRRP